MNYSMIILVGDEAGTVRQLNPHHVLGLERPAHAVVEDGDGLMVLRIASVVNVEVVVFVVHESRGAKRFKGGAPRKERHRRK